MSDIQNVLRALPSDYNTRKDLPIITGVLDYFPLALLEVARISKAGNDQHNPGQPLHWARDKSTDHINCIGRHLIERGTIDTDGVRHTAKAAWRMLALLQEEMEAAAGWTPKPDYVVPTAPVISSSECEKSEEAQRRYNLYLSLNERGVSNKVAWDFAHATDMSPFLANKELVAALSSIDPVNS